MSLAPAISASGEHLYNSVPSVFSKDEETGWFGRYLCDALMTMLQNLDRIVQDSPAETDPITEAFVAGLESHCGWSPITDPAVCPESWLVWCATLYGVTLTQNISTAAQRQQIKELPPQKRGSIEAMIKAAKETLTGAKNIAVFEQSNGESYQIVAHTETAETPSEAATREALLSQKPAGIVLTYSASSTPTWAEALKKWSEVAGTVTWANVKTGQV